MNSALSAFYKYTTESVYQQKHLQNLVVYVNTGER